MSTKAAIVVFIFDLRRLPGALRMEERSTLRVEFVSRVVIAAFAN
jgi:hypothetical protein